MTNPESSPESVEEQEKGPLTKLMEELGVEGPFLSFITNLEEWFKSKNKGEDSSQEPEPTEVASEPEPSPAERQSTSSEFLTGPSILAASMQTLAGIGDSIGEGMNMAGFDNMEGHSGWTTSRLLTRLREIISTGNLQQQGIQSFVIYAGGNDINNGISNETSVSNLRSMVTELKAIGIQPVLCTKYMTDQYSGVEGTDEIGIIEDFNQRVLTLAAEEGVPVFDFGRKYSEPSGVHDSSRYRGMVSEITTAVGV